MRFTPQSPKPTRQPSNKWQRRRPTKTRPLLGKTANHSKVDFILSGLPLLCLSHFSWCFCSTPSSHPAATERQTRPAFAPPHESEVPTTTKTHGRDCDDSGYLGNGKRGEAECQLVLLERILPEGSGKMMHLFFFFFCLFRATPAAYEGSQARGLIRAVAASLHHSHSHTRSELHLANYTTAHGNAGSLTRWAGPGIKPSTSRFLVRFVNHCATTGTPLPTSLANIL